MCTVPRSTRMEKADNPLSPEGMSGYLHAAHVRALTALSASQVPYLLLRLPVAAAGPVKDLDLLLAPAALGDAGAVLREVGFRPKTSPPGMPSKIVFSTYDEGRFHSLDVHTTVVSRGLVYLDASLLLERRLKHSGVPLPSPEDALLHLVLHPLLRRRELGGKYSDRIRHLAALPLDERYMRRHLARFNLQQVFREALNGIIDGGMVDPSALHRTARRRLSLRLRPSARPSV